MLYPDNKNRANRVTQLSGDITHLQTEIEQNIKDAEAHDKQALEVLDKFAKKKGYNTLDEFLKNAEKQLTDDDRKRYQEMKTHFEKKDARLDLALKSSLGLVGTGVSTSMSGLSTLLKGSLLRVSLQAIGVGIVQVLTGQFTEGVALLRAAGNIISTAYKGELVTGKAATALKFLGYAGKVLSVLGLVLDAVILIYDAVDGARQRTEFQKAIKELCARRLSTKKIREYVRITLSYSGDARAAIDYAQTLQEDLVDKGEMSQSDADAKVQKKLDALQPKISKEMETITDDSTYKALQEQDTKTSAWTNEDPTLEEMQKMIEEMGTEK
ncbi:hypothetical protein AMATHDRAFT_8815 [Amanita thiersii Skay4041]|uniref:Uncharacterized protein n=1 Tax=Amanita thiersii Skay4041 TaxID=703135 RepID=A0A2A9N6J1_9AGAR|nr:hypothetical protein AMATHDRAFT_8815 [Amanita thiersii Skay4041]